MENQDSKKASKKSLRQRGKEPGTRWKRRDERETALKASPVKGERSFFFLTLFHVLIFLRTKNLSPILFHSC